MGAPCGWTVETCGCGSCWNEYSPAIRTAAAALATTVIWAATGRRYGLCEVTVLPCNPPAAEPLYQTFPIGVYSPFGLGDQPVTVPVLAAGTWHNLACGGGCRCQAACEVPLPGPVHDVVEVLVDGEEVAPSAYEIHDGYLLVRTDGECWPSCQIFGQEIPDFEATYHRGDPIPTPIDRAAALLACEYAKACAGKACGLPSRMKRLTRQGVEVEVADVPKDGKGRIRTGLRWVDDALDADNPYGLAERPTVMSIDLPEPRMVTWRGGS